MFTDKSVQIGNQGKQIQFGFCPIDFVQFGLSRIKDTFQSTETTVFPQNHILRSRCLAFFLIERKSGTDGFDIRL
ncbi:hypothetical protein Barb7_00801 [Bacteroidales bacterium Barb7]|nr:hypothetical protein Barb7_00801 [Bacteroidales bacterium Barb7]